MRTIKVALIKLNSWSLKLVKVPCKCKSCVSNSSSAIFWTNHIICRILISPNATFSNYPFILCAVCHREDITNINSDDLALPYVYVRCCQWRNNPSIACRLWPSYHKFIANYIYTRTYGSIRVTFEINRAFQIRIRKIGCKNFSCSIHF